MTVVEASQLTYFNIVLNRAAEAFEPMVPLQGQRRLGQGIRDFIFDQREAIATSSANGRVAVVGCDMILLSFRQSG